MSNYSKELENHLHYLKITQTISRWKADCGFTPTVSPTNYKRDIVLDIHHALNALCSLYTIPKVHLSGTSAGLYFLASALSTCNPEETRVVWYSNPNYAKLSTLAQQLSSLKILCRQLESEKYTQLFHSSGLKRIRHRLIPCLRMIKLLRGSTVTKLVNEEVLLLDNLAAFLQTLQTLPHYMTPNSIPNNK